MGLFGDITNAFHTVYNEVMGGANFAINGATYLGGQLMSATSGFTTSIFLNWFLILIIKPIVNFIGWVMQYVVREIMYGVASVIAGIFAVPNGLAQYFENHLSGLGIAGPIALSFALGLIFMVSLAIGFVIFTIVKRIGEA